MANGNLIKQIEDVLCYTHGLDTGSAITQAVTYVIFNRYSTRLVQYHDRPDFADQINRTMVLDGIKHVKEVLNGWEESLLRKGLKS